MYYGLQDTCVKLGKESYDERKVKIRHWETGLQKFNTVADIEGTSAVAYDGTKDERRKIGLQEGPRSLQPYRQIGVLNDKYRV